MPLWAVHPIYHSPAGDRRAGGIDLHLDDFGSPCSKIPLLVNLMPSGKFLMEDFYHAGGSPGGTYESVTNYTRNVITVSGKTTMTISALLRRMLHREGDCYRIGSMIPEAGCAHCKGKSGSERSHQTIRRHTLPCSNVAGAVVLKALKTTMPWIDDDGHSISMNLCDGNGNMSAPVGYPGMPQSRQYGPAQRSSMSKIWSVPDGRDERNRLRQPSSMYHPESAHPALVQRRLY